MKIVKFPPQYQCRENTDPEQVSSKRKNKESTGIHISLEERVSLEDEIGAVRDGKNYVLRKGKETGLAVRVVLN